MGTILFGNCETCCGKDNQDIESDNYPILLKKTSRFSQYNQNYQYVKKILISSSPTNFNLIGNSAISDRTDLSISFDNSQLKLFKNDILNLQNNLISFQLYEKMINGERLHNILEALTFYNNNILFELLLSILNKINDIFKDNFFDEKDVIFLHKNFVKVFQELNEKNIFEEIKLNIEEDSRLKYNLLDIIESVIELYHFFKYKILNDQEPYNKFYWEQYKNCVNYMEQKVIDIKKGIININLSIGENKLKIIE